VAHLGKVSTEVDAGGWEHDTLTEDFDLSYRAELKGWKFRYFKDIVCKAEIPAMISAYKSQQFRWCKGSIQTAVKLLPRIWNAELPWRIKSEAIIHLINYSVHPLMVINILFTAPLLLMEFWSGFNLFDLPVVILYGTAAFLSIGSIGPIIFYMYSQREIYPDWKSRIFFLPVMIMIGTGVAIVNTRAWLEAGGIISMVGSSATLTPSAASLLPITVGMTTFTTTTQVQAHINTTNTQVSTLIQSQNDLTGHYDNYTKLKNSDPPYTGLLGYQKANYTGANKANFASLTGFSTEAQNLTQLDSYNNTTNKPPVYGYQGELNDINQKIASLQEDCNATSEANDRRLAELEELTIVSLIKDQEKVLGYKTKFNPLTIAFKYRTLKAINPKTNILEFVDKEFRDNSALAKVENKINNLGRKASGISLITIGISIYEAGRNVKASVITLPEMVSSIDDWIWREV
jgi:hypothetical protein